jgi:secreted Zn-dependent insulinase-like peptidase
MQFESGTIPKGILNSWNTREVGKDLLPPPPNPFIPSSFTLITNALPNVTAKEAAIGGYVLPRGALTAPECVVDTPGLRVLHKAVTAFSTPRAVAMFR